MVLLLEASRVFGEFVAVFLRENIYFFARCGVNAVIFYTVYIFRASVDRTPGAEGGEGIVDEHSATIIVGVVQFLATFGEDQAIPK